MNRAGHPMTHLVVYSTEACGRDGYPLAWHSIEGEPGVKHVVREQAGHRCVRCGHPYAKGAGEWSPCDDQCSHVGPARGVFPSGARTPYWDHPDTLNDPDLCGIEARWRILTVHHLNGVKRDCRWWNLAALCQRCHLQIQGKVVMDRIWPWPHSDWFKPYAAGWYAAAYLGLELTRDETLARLDELLALELAPDTSCRGAHA